MKKLLTILSVIVITFLIVTPVFAAGKGPTDGRNGAGSGSTVRTEQKSPRGTFALTGTIAEVGTNYVTVNVLRGNKLVQPYISTQIKLTLTSNTRFLFTDGVTTTVISLADLQVDQTVSVNGLVVNDIWAATRITVGASLSCLP